MLADNFGLDNSVEYITLITGRQIKENEGYTGGRPAKIYICVS